MSAENWTVCPNCLAKHRAARDKAIKAARESYGAVDPAEYERMTLDANKIPSEPQDSLREDYEIGVNKSGEFEVSFRCSCDVCGFAFGFSHTEKIKLPKE